MGLDGRAALSVGATDGVVLLFPGQGSQRPGMGADLADAFPPSADVFRAVDAALGLELSALCFHGPEEALTSTENAQPALLAHGAAAWAAVQSTLAPHVRAAAGHSLGEFTAHVASRALSLSSGARLVRRRGELMFASGQRSPGTMAAILGLADDLVDEVCRAASDAKDVVVPANYNSPEQVVVSGAIAAVERAMALAKARGARRALRLNVSGAFHSPLMRDAADGLAGALAEATFSEPSFPVYSNVTAEPVMGAAASRSLLVTQLTSPVRWRSLVVNLAHAYPAALFVEVGPGSVLTNLTKRIAPGMESAMCGTRADVERLAARFS
ncbi:MAG: ACP S-malonyltransferase [Gemmatimonadaceae bacterium]